VSFDFPKRIARLQTALGGAGIDVALLSVGPDLPYFTGYEAMASERLTVLAVRPEGESVLFVPELEAPRVTPGGFEVRAWRETEDPIRLASSLVSKPARVAVGDHMWAVFVTRFIEEWPDSSLVPASSVTQEMRILKDPSEIEYLRLAARAVDRVMARIPLEVAFAGRTEAQVARDLAELTVEEGHDSAEFTIVASGPNGASPHHHPGERVISEGDLVVSDFGGRWRGYYSDSTRTFVVGEADAGQRAAHEAVLEANRAGRAAVAPDVPCQEVDRVARRVISEAGFGDRFIHRTGHGIGLEVHEHPYMVEGNDRPLEPGMAFSVEPGVYLPGRLGVRIEDIVVCTDDGGESLNQSDRGLVPVG
jgi:Xaa-Pro aminopeptidase